MVAGKLKEPWHVAAPEKLEALRAMLVDHFPRLHALTHDETVFVEGTFDLVEGGVRIDSFLIRIVLPRTYPIGMPEVLEIGGRVPQHVDWHVNASGSLCVGLPEELWLRFGGRFELKAFLDGPVRSYFVGVCEKLAGRPWPWGEWAHGAPALREFYSRMIGTDDVERLKELLATLERDTIKGHWSCPCGSRKEMRRCHLPAVREAHARLPKAMFTRYLKILSGPSGEAATE